MNPLLQRLITSIRFMAPEDGAGAAGAIDRGDDFTPTTEEEDEAAAAAAAATETKVAAEPKADPKDAGAADDAKEEAGDADKGAAGLGAAEDDKKGGKKDSRIPLSRHKEILERERSQREALEAELKKVREGQAAVKLGENLTEAEAQVVAKEEQYTELLAEGKTKEATALMREIRQLERSIIEQKAEYNTQVAQAQAVEKVRFDTTVERLEEAYPQLKPGTEEFDKDLVAEILDMKAAFEGRGYTASQALQKAVGYVIKPESKKQETAVTTTPRVNAEDAAAKVAAERATEARKKNAAAANAQPPAMAKVGADSDKSGGVLTAATAIKMKFEDFIKLDEAELSRLRGD